MQLNNPTLGQLERLYLLGCDVMVQDGTASVTLLGIALAAINSVAHRANVLFLRKAWATSRCDDRLVERELERAGFSDAIHCQLQTTYQWMQKYKSRQLLPARWFNRV